MRFLFALTVVVLIMHESRAADPEQVPNPEFAGWSKFKKGASVTLKTTATVSGIITEVTETKTLIEVEADKLVLEISAASKLNNMEIKMPPTKRDVVKTITLPKGAKKEEYAAAEKPLGTYEEGTETLTIAGTEIKSKWYKYKTELGGIKTEAKMWVSDDVPGRMVKLEANRTGNLTATSKTELAEFKKP